MSDIIPEDLNTFKLEVKRLYYLSLDVPYIDYRGDNDEETKVIVGETPIQILEKLTKTQVEILLDIFWERPHLVDRIGLNRYASYSFGQADFMLLNGKILPDDPHIWRGDEFYSSTRTVFNVEKIYAHIETEDNVSKTDTDNDFFYQQVQHHPIILDACEEEFKRKIEEENHKREKLKEADEKAEYKTYLRLKEKYEGKENG